MDRITLQKVDESNFIACFNLELNDGQEQFVSHPIRSLAQAYVYYQQCTPFAVFSGGEVVGYVMVIYDYDEETYNIWHLMVDRRHQRKGAGVYLYKALRCFQPRPDDRKPPKLRRLRPVPGAGLYGNRALGRGRSGIGADPQLRLIFPKDCITVIILFPKTML